MGVDWHSVQGKSSEAARKAPVRGSDLGGCVEADAAQAWQQPGKSQPQPVVANVLMQILYAARIALVGLLRDRYCTAQHQLDLWVVHGRSLRGLEYMITRERCDEHRMSRRNHRLAVLDAQDVLRRTGVDNAAMIAKIASATSKQAREFATRMGLADYRALQQECQSPTVPPARRQSSYLPRPGRPPCLTEWSRRPSQIMHTALNPSKPCS